MPRLRGFFIFQRGARCPARRPVGRKSLSYPSCNLYRERETLKWSCKPPIIVRTRVKMPRLRSTSVISKNRRPVGRKSLLCSLTRPSVPGPTLLAILDLWREFLSHPSHQTLPILIVKFHQGFFIFQRGASLCPAYGVRGWDTMKFKNLIG